MKVLTLLFSAALCFGAENNQDRGRRIVDEAIAALGGERFLTMKNRVETGFAYSFYHEQVSGRSRAKIFTEYLDQPAAPNQLAQRERQDFGKKSESSVLLSGGEGWELTYRGARPLPSGTIARYFETTLNNVFYIFRVRLKEPGLTFESKGSDVIDNLPVEIVDITDSENRTVKVYFHRSTKLPIRQVFFRRDPKTRERLEELTTFTKYREVDGIQWPMTIHRERNGDKTYEIFSEQIQFNETMGTDLFSVPSDTKRLKPVE
jgi:hypothetical protein